MVNFNPVILYYSKGAHLQSIGIFSHMFQKPVQASVISFVTKMTTDQETATSGQPHLAKQSLVGLDVAKLTPLSPEVYGRSCRLEMLRIIL